MPQWPVHSAGAVDRDREGDYSQLGDRCRRRERPACRCPGPFRQRIRSAPGPRHLALSRVPPRPFDHAVRHVPRPTARQTRNFVRRSPAGARLPLGQSGHRRSSADQPGRTLPRWTCWAYHRRFSALWATITAPMAATSVARIPATATHALTTAGDLSSYLKGSHSAFIASSRSQRLGRTDP